MGIDLAFDDEDLAKAARALGEDANPAAALELVADEGDVHRREQAVSVLGVAGGPEIDQLRALATQRSYRPERWLLLGAALSAAAWAVREPPRPGRHLDRAIIAQKALVAEARTALHRAAALSPGDAVPWSELAGAVIGGPLHVTEPADTFKRACVLAPGLYLAHARHLIALTRRWYGSPDHVLAFAHARTAGRPAGHPLHALVALAHAELYVDGLLRGTAVGRFWRAWRSFGQPAVRADLDPASDRLLAGDDAHPWSSAAHRAFAAVYHRAGDLERARTHLSRSGATGC